MIVEVDGPSKVNKSSLQIMDLQAGSNQAKKPKKKPVAFAGGFQ
jgi:hypothetical protein